MKKLFLFLFATAIGLASCQQDTAEDAALSANVYSFDAIGEESRVTLDHTNLTYAWSVGDKAMAWYAPQTSSPDYNYRTVPAPFVAEGAGETTRFSLSGHDLSSMGTDPQHYVLMYPWPNAGTAAVSGDEVTYTIGTRFGDGYVQGNAFEDSYNLMRAEVDGPSLNVQRPRLTFSHLLTSLRLYVKKADSPIYDDLKINGMEILFPENVVGETKVNYRTGAVASASGNKVIVNLVKPLTPLNSYLDENGVALDDHYALVVVKPFTLQANNDDNTQDRIVVTLTGTGKDIHTGEVRSISQSIVVKTKTDAVFAAGRFRAINLKLTNDWTPTPVQLTDEFAPKGDYADGLSIRFEKRGECWGFHALLKAAGEIADSEVLVLDNTSSRKLGTRHAQAAFYMPKSGVLPGYTTGKRVVVTFDAYGFLGKNDDISVWVADNDVTSTTNGDSGDSGRKTYNEVKISPVAYKASNVPNGYPAATAWNRYTAVLENGFATDKTRPYVGFYLPGRGNDGRYAIIYIKDIVFSYEKN